MGAYLYIYTYYYVHAGTSYARRPLSAIVTVALTITKIYTSAVKARRGFLFPLGPVNFNLVLSPKPAQPKEKQIADSHGRKSLPHQTALLPMGVLAYRTQKNASRCPKLHFDTDMIPAFGASMTFRNPIDVAGLA